MSWCENPSSRPSRDSRWRKSASLGTTVLKASASSPTGRHVDRVVEGLQLLRCEVLEQLGALQVRQLETLGIRGRNTLAGHALDSRRRTLSVPAPTAGSTIAGALCALL
jgi:hypothetical protein